MASPSYHLEYLEKMAGVVIPGLEIPCGTLLVYEVDADLRPIPKESSSRLRAIPSVPSKYLESMADDVIPGLECRVALH